jgi:hypothetical protein
MRFLQLIARVHKLHTVFSVLLFLLVQDLYKQRKQLVSRTCRRYGLGNFPPPQKEEEEEVEAGLYRRQEAAYSTPLEKSLMLEKNWRLLLCWNHKVVLIEEGGGQCICYLLLKFTPEAEFKNYNHVEVSGHNLKSSQT